MKKRSGFTLIEVAIFLAITGVLFVGVAVGTSNSVYQQRFTDSVQNFAEFLRNVYSEVANPQSAGNGRSDKALYGRLITFGEQYSGQSEDEKNKVFVYDVIGNIVGDFGTGDLQTMLYKIGAEAIVKGSGYNGLMESYSPKWGARIERTGNTNALSHVAILIVRHPRSGTIYTLVSDQTVQVRKAMQNSSTSKPLNDALKVTGTFKPKTVDFCVSPELGSKRRQDVRIVMNARNATGVEIIPLDDSDNKCR